MSKNGMYKPKNKNIHKLELFLNKIDKKTKDNELSKIVNDDQK